MGQKVKNITLVITDPCYIKHGSCLMRRDTLYGDWSCMVFPGNIKENQSVDEWTNMYFDFFNEYNFTGKTSEEKSKMYDDWKEKKNTWMRDNGILGEFCADAGEVGIFDWRWLSEEDKEWCKSHPWCAAIIEDWSGDIDIEVIGESVHVIGCGDRPFFTSQTGL